MPVYGETEYDEGMLSELETVSQLHISDSEDDTDTGDAQRTTRFSEGPPVPSTPPNQAMPKLSEKDRRQQPKRRRMLEASGLPPDFVPAHPAKQHPMRGLNVAILDGDIWTPQ